MASPRNNTASALVALVVASPMFLLGNTDAAAQVNPDEAQVLWRWIGVLNSLTSCPDPDSGHADNLWGVESFDVGNRRFCVYDYLDTPPVTGTSRVASTTPGGGWAAPPVPDAMVVQSMAMNLSEALGPNLEARFEHEAGAVTLPLQGGHPAVRFSLIDTTPAGNPSAQNSPHGKSLGTFVQHFLCDQGTDCIVEEDPHLALGYTHFNQLSPTGWNSSHGGYVGLLSRLAGAIRAAVSAWAESTTPHLVLNLSVAWDGDLFGGATLKPTHMSAPEQMVYYAIEEAVCAGALVVAAAGNKSDDLQMNGPLLPAAWEKFEAPAECQLSNAPYQPLVYAAGAVLADNLPLPNVRRKSWSPLVAYGDHAATSQGPKAWTAPLTGTSVSALVVSMAAAAVWYYFPDLEAAEVMEQVYDSGEVVFVGSTKVAPDFCLGTPQTAPCKPERPEARRIRLCQAVRTACAEGSLGGGCPGPLDPDSSDPCPMIGASSPWVDLVIPFPTISAGIDALLPPGGPCSGNGSWFHDALNNAPDSYCPSHEFNGVGSNPWVSPQPNLDPCPPCKIKNSTSGNFALSSNSTSLYLQISPPFVGKVCSMTLTRCNTHDVLSNIPPGDLRIDLLPVSPPCSSASLSYLIDDIQPYDCSPPTKSAFTPLLVVGPP